jgi:hypothetical protein
MVTITPSGKRRWIRASGHDRLLFYLGAQLTGRQQNQVGARAQA